MMDLSSTVGTNSVLNSALNILKAEENCSVQVVGEPGRGKSWIASKVKEQLATIHLSCIHLFGDEKMVSESYYPFKRFIETKDKHFNKGVSVFKEAIQAIPYVGKSIKVLIDDYNFRKGRLGKTMEEVEPFKSHIAFSLHIAGLLKKFSKIIIIADDIDLFDSETIRFLSSLNMGLIDMGLSASVSIIYFSTAEINLSFGTDREFNFILPKLTINQTRDAIKIWSEKEVSDADLEIIFSCTHGHLQLIKIVSHYLKNVTSSELNKNFKGLLIWIIESRLKSVKHYYEKMKNLIISINYAGKKSSSFELLCLLENSSEVKELISQGVQMDLLVVRDNYIHFSHNIVEEYVLSLQNKHPTDFYNKLSACTKKINPSDYERRAVIEIGADKCEQADIFWALAAIQKFQKGLITAGLSLANHISDSALGNEVKAALKQFAVCYTLSLDGLLNEAILEIESIPNTLPRLVLAERFYLKCLNLAKRISQEAKKDVLSIIDDWEDLKEEEPEIWYRFAQIKIIAAAEAGEIAIALKTEAAIIKYFSNRLTIDVYARKILERINLFAEVLYSPEIAHKKMLFTEEQITKSVLKEQYDRVFDLYIIRTNLSGNSFVIDDSEKSLKYAGGAIAILKEFPEVKFPYPEAAENNFYLTLLFSDSSQLQYIITKYTDLIYRTNQQENKILLTINFAGLYILSDQPSLSLDILQESGYIPTLIKDDYYYYYYYWINYALTCFLVGKNDEAKNIIEALKDIPGLISHFLSSYYRMHYSLIQEIILTNSITTYKQILDFINEREPLFSSKIWNKFKFGYLFTDIQIWTYS